MLHVAINKVSNATRGRSDLAPLLPWLRHYREWLTDRVRLNRYKGAFLYDVSIYVVAKSDNEKQIKETIEARKALITDRIRTIIAQTDPEKLGGGSEPGLETLRRQVKYQLDEIVGEGMIEEVLVPRCTPFRADY